MEARIIPSAIDTWATPAATRWIDLSWAFLCQEVKGVNESLGYLKKTQNFFRRCGELQGNIKCNCKFYFFQYAFAKIRNVDIHSLLNYDYFVSWWESSHFYNTLIVDNMLDIAQEPEVYDFFSRVLIQGSLNFHIIKCLQADDYNIHIIMHITSYYAVY